MKKKNLVYILAMFLFIGGKRATITYPIGFDQERTSFNTEDRAGRSYYEWMLTASPRTGKIPDRIRSAELQFSKTIEAYTAHLRKQDLDIALAGPVNVGGRTRAVAFDVRNENIIIAGGVSGGIWKSTDGGGKWIRKSNPENRNSVTCLVQDTRPGHEDTWYHGTGELDGNSARNAAAPYRGSGIYKSTDNGETWEPIASTQDSSPEVFNSQFQYIWNIIINEDNLVQDELFVAAWGGILRSLDGGDTWNVELGQTLFNLEKSINVNNIKSSRYTSIERTEDGVYFASLSTFFARNKEGSPQAGIFASSDGLNWHNITPFPPQLEYKRIVIGASPSQPDKIYFLGVYFFEDADPPFLLRFDLNTISPGAISGNWVDLTQNIPMFGGEVGDFDAQGSFNMMVKVHPTDPNTVFVGGTNLYRSTDGFTSTSNTKWIGGYDPENDISIYPDHHPDQHDLLFYPSNPDQMLSACDGGLALTKDGTADSVFWIPKNDGYITSQFFTIALSKEANDDMMLGGMQDNGTDITTGRPSWSDLFGGDGGYVATTPGKKLWFVSFQNSQVYRLTLGQGFELTSFARVDPQGAGVTPGQQYLTINPYILDPTNHNRMFIAGGEYLYLNENVSQVPGGSQHPTSLGWSRIEDSFLYEGVITALGISPDGETLFFGTSPGRVFRVDGANDFAQLTVTELNSPVLVEKGFVSCIAIDPDNAEHLMLTYSNYEIPSVFRSTDGGGTFTDVSGNLEENPDGTGSGPSIRWVEIIPKLAGNLYLVGSSTGLYSTEAMNGAATIWGKESTGEIGSAVITMMDYRTSDGRLAVATHGSGVYTTSIDGFKKTTPPTSEVKSFEIVNAYPNPFNQSTKIRYHIPESGTVKIDVYNASGEHITNLLWANQFAGQNAVVWNGTNNTGNDVGNGVYFYRIRNKTGARSGRLIVRK